MRSRTLWMLLGCGLLLAAALPAAADAPRVVICNAMVAGIVGTPGDDILYGDGGPDVIAGLGGNDEIFGGGGNDSICGGAGNDHLLGEDGVDYLYGGAGRDLLNGGDAADLIYGGPGNDELIASGGDDVFDGEGGVDLVAFDMIGHGVHASLLQNLVVPLAGPNPAEFVVQTIYAENLRGTGYHDILPGHLGAQPAGWLVRPGRAGRPAGQRCAARRPGTGHWRNGGDGDDRVVGGPGNDSLWGDNGFDTVIGGGGTDTCGGEVVSTCEA